MDGFNHEKALPLIRSLLSQNNLPTIKELITDENKKNKLVKQ